MAAGALLGPEVKHLCEHAECEAEALRDRLAAAERDRAEALRWIRHTLAYPRYLPGVDTAGSVLVVMPMKAVAAGEALLEAAEAGGGQA